MSADLMMELAVSFEEGTLLSKTALWVPPRDLYEVKRSLKTHMTYAKGQTQENMHIQILLTNMRFVAWIPEAVNPPADRKSLPSWEGVWADFRKNF